MFLWKACIMEIRVVSWRCICPFDREHCMNFIITDPKLLGQDSLSLSLSLSLYIYIYIYIYIYNIYIIYKRRYCHDVLSLTRGVLVHYLGSTLDHAPWSISWRPRTVKWRQFSQSNRHSTIGTRQTEYHEALPSSVNIEVRCDCTFADDGDASWYSVCRMSMVKWRLDCENCRHLTVVGLHDAGPRSCLRFHLTWFFCARLYLSR